MDYLTELANKYKTDKGTVDAPISNHKHGYAYIYDKFFFSTRKQVKKVFEIGIFDGASLKMWRDYFPNATVYGMDFHEEYCEIFKEEERVKTFLGQQEDKKNLEKFIKTYGVRDFDLIVDDGGHKDVEQQVSFAFLFSYVKTNGFYIIEDLHTQFLKKFCHAPERSTYKMVTDYIKKEKIESMYMTIKEKIYLNQSIKKCWLYELPNPVIAKSPWSGVSITCVFEKK